MYLLYTCTVKLIQIIRVPFPVHVLLRMALCNILGLQLHGVMFRLRQNKAYANAYICVRCKP